MIAGAARSAPAPSANARRRDIRAAIPIPRFATPTARQSRCRSIASRRPLMLHHCRDEQSCVDAGGLEARPAVPRWVDGLAAGRTGRPLHYRAVHRSDWLRAPAQRHRSDGVARSLPPLLHRSALRLRDGATQRRRGCRLSRRGGLELLDRLRGPHLCLADHSRQQGTTRRNLRLGRMGQTAPTAVHLVQLDARHDPRPPPLHGTGALRRHAQDRSLLRAGGRGARRAPLRRISPRFPAAQPAGGRQRLRARVHHVPRLLHYADPARHAQGHDDLPTHQPADRGPAGLGLCLGDRGRPAGVHACAARRLQSLRRLGSAVGIGAMARHVPLLLASLAAIFLVAPMAIIVPMSFSKAISFEFPPPGYWTGYYVQYFSSHSWLEATANSFIIAFASMALTLVAALPAAFGFVRYRFHGKSMLNLVMMLPIIVPAVVSALGYYSFLGPLHLVGTHAGMIVAHSVLSIPVAFLVVAAALKGFDRNLERAAMSAGAGPLRTFLWVTLPVLRPAILVGALFAFLHSFNEAVVAIFIAGRDASTLPKKMFESIRLESDPVIAVVSTLLTGAVLLGVLIAFPFRPRA